MGPPYKEAGKSKSQSLDAELVQRSFAAGKNADLQGPEQTNTRIPF